MGCFLSIRWLLLALVLAVVLESIWLPTNVTKITQYGTSHYTNHYNDHEYVWALLKPAPVPDTLPDDFNIEWHEETRQYLNVTRYAARTALTLAIALFAWLVLRRYASLLERKIWLVPLGLYLCAALARLLYVPCTWVNTHFSYRYPEVRSATLPIWAIGTEEIRYGLLFFHEFLLLALLIAAYGCVFVIVPSVRPRFLERTFRRRVAD